MERTKREMLLDYISISKYMTRPYVEVLLFHTENSYRHANRLLKLMTDKGELIPNSLASNTDTIYTLKKVNNMATLRYHSICAGLLPYFVQKGYTVLEMNYEKKIYYDTITVDCELRVELSYQGARIQKVYLVFVERTHESVRDKIDALTDYMKDASFKEDYIGVVTVLFITDGKLPKQSGIPIITLPTNFVRNLY